MFVLLFVGFLSDGNLLGIISGKVKVIQGITSQQLIIKVFYAKKCDAATPKLLPLEIVISKLSL